MDLDKFLNLIAAILGTVGAVYVMWSILAMSPELIEQQARTRWDFSVPQIESLAQQKADNVAGFIFVILALFSRAYNRVHSGKSPRFPDQRRCRFCCSCICGGPFSHPLFHQPRAL